MHRRSLGDRWRIGPPRSGRLPMFEEALKEAVPVDQRHDGAELLDDVFGGGALRIGTSEEIPEVRAVQSLECHESLGHGGPIALNLRRDPRAIGRTERAEGAGSGAEKVRVLGEEIPIGIGVGASAADEVLRSKGRMLMPGNGRGVIDDANAALGEPGAEFRILGDAEGGIEISSSKHGAAGYAQITGHEIGLIANLAGFERALREEERRKIDEEAKSAGGGLFRIAEVAEYGPGFAGAAAMKRQVLGKQVRRGDGVVVAEKQKLAPRGGSAAAASGSRALILLANLAHAAGKQKLTEHRGRIVG